MKRKPVRDNSVRGFEGEIVKPFEKHPDECLQIVSICQKLYQKNMLAAADGNVSVKVSSGILITPSGVAKAFAKPEEMALINENNEILHGQPSSERLMHLAVYNQCPQARAVIHAHPTTAIAWTVAFPRDKELPGDCLSEIILATGRIPIVDYARPGTRAMGDVLLPFIRDYKVMILSRHGALSWGESLEEAYMGMERLEHSAEILYQAKSLGGLTFLPEEEKLALQEMRKKLGNKSL